MIIRRDFLNLLGIFLIWKLLLTIVSFLAINFVSLGYKDRFLGGGLDHYLLAPYLFSWANFDGEHYISIAIIGYKGLEQAFFPVYPKTIGLLASPFHADFFSFQVATIIVGLVISNLCILLAIIILWDLVRLDYSKDVSYLTIILLLAFPTSFYFSSLYNESLFLLLSVGSFYAARKDNWWLAGMLGGVASATRIFGILIFPALLLQLWSSKTSFKQSIWLLIIPVGLLIYMFYLWVSVNDPIAFFHLQAIVGEQRASGFTLLPRTFFRYFNMLTTVSIYNLIYQTLVLEFVSGIMFLVLPIYGYFKKQISVSYVFYALVAYLVASSQGSFSSLPRYALVLFPSFIVLAIIISDCSKSIRGIVILLMSVFLFIETALFLRGYWVA